MVGASNYGRDLKTFNVKQRSFCVITKHSEFPILLRTGYIGPCVAFYGFNERQGVAFMAHIDGNVRGVGKLMERLKEAANGDLEGFSLYAATNWSLIWLSSVSLISIMLIAAIGFKASRIKLNNRFLLWGRIEVSVDTAHGPGQTCKELISSKESIVRYAPPTYGTWLSDFRDWLKGLRESQVASLVGSDRKEFCDKSQPKQRHDSERLKEIS